jgi:pyruvate formate lyase activating enzyme
MRIGGIQKFSLIDYPGRLAAVIFTQGCNFRCPYCHNPELVNPKSFGKSLPEDSIISFLEKRSGRLDGVSITGGEPALQPDLIPFIERVKRLGYAVKIDTNGTLPGVLDELIERRLVDYIAMDIKGPFKKYGEIAGAEIDTEIIRQSVERVMNSGIDYEFRTTVVKSLLTAEDLQKTAALIRGARRYVLQKFVPSKCLDERFARETTYTEKEFEEIIEKLSADVRSIVLR